MHNRYVVENLEAKGAVFVEELEEVPAEVPVVFSAHGVAKSVFAEAEEREMYYLDATCPLVTKVHVDAARHRKEGKDLMLIGHAGHPEVVGTMGQLRDGEMILVENAEQAETVDVPVIDNLAFVTQMTLSVDDTAKIVGIQRRFPQISRRPARKIFVTQPPTGNRVKELADKCDALIVLGAQFV